MACVDTSRSDTLPILMEMVGAVSRAETPKDVLRDFSRGMRHLNPMDGYISLSTRGLGPGEYRITRYIDYAEQKEIGDTDSWSNPQKFPVHAGGFLGALVRQAYPELIHHLDLKDDPVLGSTLASFGSLMAVPLFDNGEPLNWAIMLRRDPEGFDLKDLEESILQGNLVGSTVRNVLAAERLRAANTAIRDEMDRIASIQRALLPTLPEIPGLSLGTSYETFDQAGGDLYALRPLRSGADGTPDPSSPWGIMIGDASGHGPAAAVVMAMLIAILDAYPHEPAGPGEVLAHANRHLCAKNIEHTFVTAFFGIYCPSSRRFAYARAGHNPPLLLARDDAGMHTTRLDAVGSLPLGITPDVEYDETTVELAVGQSIVMYTDGITESFSPDGQMFGLEGIEHSLRTCSGEPSCVIGHVRSALAEHAQGVRPGDDQTMVVMRVDA